MPRYTYRPKKTLAALIGGTSLVLTLGLTTQAALAEEVSSTNTASDVQLTAPENDTARETYVAEVPKAAPTSESFVTVSDETLQSGKSTPPATDAPAESGNMETADTTDADSAAADSSDEANKPLDDGNFVISAKGDTSKVLDAAGASTADETNVLLWDSKMSSNQRWTLNYNKEFDAYTIGLKGTNKVLDVAYGVAKNGANVQIYHATGGKNQLWKIVKQTDNSYVLHTLLNDKYVLDLFAGSTVNGNNIGLWEYLNSAAQHFAFFNENQPGAEAGIQLDTSSSYQIITNNGSYVSTSIDDASLAKSASGANQSFSFVEADGGYYYVKNNATGEVLQSKNANVAPGTSLSFAQQQAGLKGQLWAVKDAGQGRFYLVNKDTGYIVYQTASGLAYSDTSTFTSALSFKAITNPAAGEVYLPNDGTYYFISGLSSQKYLTYSNGAPGAPVVISSESRGTNQMFDIVRAGDSDCYAIYAHGTNLGLDIMYNQGTDGNKVTLYTFSGNNNQLFKFVKSKFGYQIVSKLRPDLVLDIPGSSLRDNKQIIVWSANGQANEAFRLQEATFAKQSDVIEEGVYELAIGKADSNYVVDIFGRSLANGGNAIVWTRSGFANQHYVIQSNGKGYYSIINVQSGKALDVAGGNMAPGTNVLQWDFTGADNQLWAFYRQSNGAYEIRNKLTNLTLDVQFNYINNNSNIQDWTPNGNAGQAFYLYKADLISEGIYTIVAKNNPSLVFDVYGYQKAADTPLELWTANGNYNQTFQFAKDASTGAYTIRSAHSGKVLSEKNGAVVLANESDKDLNQSLWKPIWNNGYISLQNMASNLLMSASSVLNAGAKIVLSAVENNGLQHFILQAASLLKTGASGISSDAGKSLVVANNAFNNGAVYATENQTNELNQRFYVQERNGGYVLTSSLTGGSLSVSGGKLQQSNVINNDSIFDAVVADGGVMLKSRTSGQYISFAGGNVFLTNFASSSNAITQRAFDTPEVYWYGNELYVPSNGIVYTKSNSLRARFVNEAVKIAADDSHGYDQSYRWGPNYDCSSLMYHCGYVAGLNLSWSDPRYTGSMVGDFTRAGAWRLSPHTTLQVGDILVNRLYHTAVYIGNGKIAAARINERGGAVGGRSGDQTGKEIMVQDYYDYPWTDVLRLPGQL